MVALLPDSPLFKEIFGGVNLPATFESRFPKYADLKAAFSDPAFRAKINDEYLNGSQLVDLQTGMRMLTHALVKYRANIMSGLPSQLLAGVRTLVQTTDTELAVKTADVIGKVMNAKGPMEAVGAVLGVGLAALGVTVPVVGTIAAAVVAIATAIVSVIRAQKDKLDEQKAEDRARIYRTFPPLMEASSEADDFTINNQILPFIAGGDWTDFYAPRYKGTWVGLERAGGFEFAPGEVAKRSDIFGGDQGEQWLAGDGLGCIPGTDRITGIIRVSLAHDVGDVASDPFWSFMKGNLAHDPRGIDINGVLGKTRVIDTGRWYVSTAKLLAAMWDFAMQRENPLKYRINTRRLDDEWRAYCEAGLSYIREVCYPWYSTQTGLLTPADEKKGYRINPDANLEGFFGTAVFAGVGAWKCSRMGDLRKPPTYKVLGAPSGIIGEAMGDVRVYGQQGTPIWSRNSGVFLPILDAALWPDQCMGTIYDRGPAPIKATLEALRKAQRWELWNTLVSAYVHESDAAFQADDELLEELRKARAALLKHSARFELTLADIADGEPGVPGMPGSESWLKQLQDSGVTATIKQGGKKKKAGPLGDGGPKDPPPELRLVALPSSPWVDPPKEASYVPPKKAGSSDGGVGLAVAIGAGAVGLGLVAALAARRRGR